MEYAVVRVVHNELGYVRPSGGKLAMRTESSYARENGFGHEEWNFDTTLTVNGLVYGYHYYRPAPRKQHELFTLFFVTYVRRRWALVGVYRNARYCIRGAPVTPAILRRKALNLHSLGFDLGQAWRELSTEQLLNKLRSEAESRRWAVNPDDIIVAPPELEVPSMLEFQKEFRRNFHETTATLITAADARVLEGLIGAPQHESRKKIRTILGDEPLDVDYEAVEGQPKLRAHLSRERDAKLTKLKKRSVLDAEGKLACEVCAFDFAAKYGRRGYEFCEVHHLRKISDAKGSVVTALRDLAIVCSNCHRMLHRGIPMPTLRQLAKEIHTAAETT